MTPRREEPIRFTRGRRLYQVARAYAEGENDWIGLCDGRIVARGDTRSDVAALLIRRHSEVPLAFGGKTSRSGSGESLERRDLFFPGV